MNQPEDQIKRIELKIQLLLKKQQLLQKEHDKLVKENVHLKTALQLANDDKEHLLRKIDVMKLNVGSWNETSKKEFEKSINSYLKDIEKCLSILHT